MKRKKAVERARTALRLEPRWTEHGYCWMVLDATNSGNGVYGDELRGQDHYEKSVMFFALKLIDPKYDWHEHDWHTLSGPAEQRVSKMLEWQEEYEQACRDVAPYRALVDLVIHSQRR